MNNKDMIPFNLDDLTRAAGKVTLKGQEHEVLPLDGLAYHTVQRLYKQGLETDPAALWGVCKRLVPTLPQEEVDALNPSQVSKIISIASERVEAVEKHRPKSPRPRSGRKA